MLRVWYGELDVNTDKLDTIFEKIKKKYKNKLSNKQIENISKKEMKNN